MQVLVGRHADAAQAARGPAGLAARWRPTGGGRSSATTSTWSTSAPPATPTPRSPCAALAAGKHVLVEKPMANTVAEAETMAAAAEEAAARGVLSMVGFTYRRVPAVELARQLVAEGRIGEVRQVRAQYLQDWLADAEAPLSWRLDKAKAGSGALGDIGAHIVDLTHFITGERVAGRLRDARDLRRRAAGGGELRRPARRRRQRAGTGDRRRRGAVPRPPRRRRPGGLRGHPLRLGPQERHPDRGQRHRRAPWRSTSRT